MDYKKQCAICNEQLGKRFNHLRIHKLSSKEYYDKFLKQENEGICEICGDFTSFSSIINGYHIICSAACSGKRSNKLKYINWNYKSDKLKLLEKKKICKNCGIEFITVTNSEYCNTHKCRRYSCSDPKKLNEIINYNDIKKCPYCNSTINDILTLSHHLKKHFNEKEYPNFKIIYLYLIEIGFIKKENSCKSSNCNNKTSFVGFKIGFNEFCDECITLYNINRQEWMKRRYTKEEISKRYQQMAQSSSNTYKNKLKNQEQYNELKKQWKHVGSINSIKMKAYAKTEKGQKRIKSQALVTSKKLKAKIASGEFTPCITNTYTHWNAEIIGDDNKNYKFRSSWEACFWYCNQHLKYEKLRIKYLDENKNERSYIADFYDEEKKILYEIKPKSEYLTQAYKMDMIIEYCFQNNIQFIWINEFNILNYIDENKFQTEINLIQLRKLKSGIS